VIDWKYYPQNAEATDLLLSVVDSFEQLEKRVTSDTHKFRSNRVLDILRPRLKKLGFTVEDKGKGSRIDVPVLFGSRGAWQKSFQVDAYHKGGKTVIEVEAGRAYTNFQFLKDIFEACVMHNVEYLAIAVRRTYLRNKDYEKILDFMDTLYASGKLGIPLHGIMIIGY
jgi:hypothetical protein